ncbi:MAG: xanthine dehydrogenase family protein subunit M [Rhodospirillaceae bacterium]|jgi:CO/xanthine dehydrogenase FAD-binding subunit|nr:xanthine dehydrogenase family protein subunit M [Rhodospirillaceae bacterium]MBT3534422.1 xanthine dehydrogenase family protein subunit M [Rhodospirillaceae bacterium]MBT4487274.1 xanthine dehydrogenase family protein subunit M [Rhodospirillaceae bacterium]MBT5192533.1 xanthine dehydrogenase family protein subunit M [Rhodospirillaceae bacterium]MBT5898556.1 xanthine dehydrogenase family protein subunit M [Rhodospirillaceae bacterium]
MASYFRPTDLSHALSALAEGNLTVIAGATDYYPAQVGRPVDHDILDLSGLENLSGISCDDDHWRIGAMTTWRDLIDADLPRCFDGLKAAARQIGGPQIQNTATIAGNLCNASPAADGVPPLMSLDARVVLQDLAGTTELPLAEFIQGNRRTACNPRQLLTEILVPKALETGRSGFIKLGTRSSLVISIVMVAGLVILDEGGHVRQVHLSVGACSEVAQRLSDLEADLIGKPLSADLVKTAHFRGLTPMDDHRGTATYRLEAAETLIKRLLGTLNA